MADNEDKPAAGRADAVRSAAVQAFQASRAGVTRERAQELADELATAAGRVIGALEDLRPATADDIRSLRDDLRALRDDLRALEGRVAALEAAGAPPAPKAKKAKPKHKPKS
jgi:polyhydroxyalkanoate synthesis regulator phasin